VKSCPKCKFLLTDLDASCRYCGHLLRGRDADEAWGDPGDRGVRVETEERDSVVRPAAVVRRAGGDLRPPVPAASLPQPSLRPPGHDAGFSDRPEPVRPQYSIQGQDEPRDLRRLVMAVVGVALVVLIAVALVMHSRHDASPAVTPPALSWQEVGPPAVPFQAQLPGMAKPSSLRPFDEVPAFSFESRPSSDQSDLVGAFDLPEGALAYGPDAFMKATAQRIAALRDVTFIEGLGSDTVDGRAFDVTLASSAGWGLLHLLIRGPRIYYAGAFARSDSDTARQNFDRVVQSLVPA
jgi:hypothetical protein